MVGVHVTENIRNKKSAHWTILNDQLKNLKVTQIDVSMYST